MIRFHIDCSLGIEEKLLIDYLDLHTTSGMMAYEISDDTKKPHFQGWFTSPRSCKQFRDSIKNHKDFKERLKGKFSFSDTWKSEPNALNLTHQEYFKRYMTKGEARWLKNIHIDDFQQWTKEFKSIDRTKQKTLVKAKSGKLNINQSIIEFVNTKLDTHVSRKLTSDMAFDYVIDWFGNASKDLDDFIIIRKLNVVLLHFEKEQWLLDNKRRLLDKYSNIYNT